ncbi:MAG TPA: DJ-1/PfpI family protein, partial [Aggregatilineaceae bacterium]|nr:DJ-1/PfpI family protein [Aggregatilineaceae bacterium]
APAHPDLLKALPSDKRLRWFPHIHGSVPVQAVAQVMDMPRAADGTYSMPDAIRWQSRRVALFVFEEVEVLDLAGPFEVFSMARGPAGQRLFHVTTFSHDEQPLAARNGLRLMPDVARAYLPQQEILIIPGGPNAAIERELQNAEFIAWLGEQIGRVELLLSVCTGAWMLAKAGVLRGLQATTYHTDYDRLRELDPSVVTCEGQRWADNGRVVTSAGVSAGIDMSLYTVQKLFGADIANATARRMEYAYFHAE